MTAPIRAGLVALAIGLAGIAPAVAQSDFYAGKTIKMTLYICAGCATGIEGCLCS